MSEDKGYIDGAEFIAHVKRRIAHVKRRIAERNAADREAIEKLEMELLQPDMKYRVENGVRIPIAQSMQKMADDWWRHEMLERWKKNLAAKEGKQP